MKLFIILSLILVSTACTSKKKSHCDLLEEPVTVETPVKTK